MSDPNQTEGAGARARARTNDSLPASGQMVVILGQSLMNGCPPSS